MAVFVLENPFKSKWKRAYLRVGKDGRKRLDLVNTSTERTTISYARYLLSVNLGRFLTKDEEADHKDTDASNDEIGNLQVLSVAAHSEKTQLERDGPKLHKAMCEYCSKTFEVPTWKYKSRNKFLCSKPCNAKWNRENSNWTGKTSNITDEQKSIMRELFEDGKTNYAISKVLPISIGSIFNYRKHCN